MYIGKVIGSVTSSVKYPTLEGFKLLLVQPLDEEKKAKGNPIVAVDAIHVSGEGDFVYLVSKKEATFPFNHIKLLPVDEAIVGFIDNYKILPKTKEK